MTFHLLSFFQTSNTMVVIAGILLGAVIGAAVYRDWRNKDRRTPTGVISIIAVIFGALVLGLTQASSSYAFCGYCCGLPIGFLLQRSLNLPGKNSSRQK